jgi:hypothetical protein
VRINGFKGILLSALMIFLIVLYTSSVAHAQAEFAVSPGSFTVSYVPLGEPWIIPQVLVVWNRDNISRTVFITVEVPPENAVTPGYEPIPNANWVIPSQGSITIPENSYAEVQILLNIPRWDNLAGQKWEVWIPVERQPLTGEIGVLMPTVSMKIETQGGVAPGIENVFTVSPGEITVSNVPPTGMPETIPQNVIVGNGDNITRVVSITTEIPPENAVTAGYEPIPNENWVILSPSQILIPVNSFGASQISINIPRWDNLMGKKWEVWIRVEREPLAGEIGILRPTVRMQIETTEERPALPVTLPVTLTFRKPDGNPLAYTKFYYGSSEGQETSYLGTTDSQGEITFTDSVLADQTIYFKSSDGLYKGSTYIASSIETVDVELSEVPRFPWLVVIGLLVVVVGVASVALYLWRK